MDKYNELYNLIETYAEANHLSNTKLALPVARTLLNNILFQHFRTGTLGRTSFEHCMETTKMLMDLHISLPKEEEDLLLATMLCHNLLKNVDFPKKGNELVDTYHLDPRILEAVRLVTRPAIMNDEMLDKFYTGIQYNKLALLVVLADRSNLVEQLSELSISDVNEFVSEMRSYFLPTCIYAKQHYHDCLMSVTIMMEKIRCLLDVTDIISNRYQKRELAYANEILNLMEENARLKGMIAQLTDGNLN